MLDYTKKITTKSWLRYSIILLIVIVILLAVYFFTRPVAVVVTFNQNITEDEAINTLTKYKDEIATRKPPREYNIQFFSWLHPFEEFHSIQFTIKQYQELYLFLKISDEPNVIRLLFDSDRRIFYYTE